MTGINLTSSITEKKRARQGIFDSSFLVITLLFLLTVGGYFGERYYLKTLDTTLTSLQAILEENAAQLSGSNVDRVANFDNRLMLITEQTGAKIDLQTVWQQLEKLVVPNVKLTKYEYGITEKKIIIAGTTNNLMSVAQQMVSFKSENMFTEISVQSVERNEDNGQFLFSFIVTL